MPLSDIQGKRNSMYRQDIIRKTFDVYLTLPYLVSEAFPAGEEILGGKIRVLLENRNL